MYPAANTPLILSHPATPGLACWGPRRWLSHSPFRFIITWSVSFSPQTNAQYGNFPFNVRDWCENILKKKTRQTPPIPLVDPLFGLRILHEPRIPVTGAPQPSVELIFVHGLGGSAKATWTHENGFWPSWLHEDNRFDRVRISTFGYDANFRNVLTPQNAMGIPDFATQLLDSLDVHFHKHGDVVSPMYKTDCRAPLFSLRIAWVD